MSPALRAGSSLFSPTSLSPTLWLDPSDITTLFTDTAGTTQVTAHGDVVARINNKGSAGGFFSQSTSAARPIYQDVGGLKYLLFDNTDDTMTSTLTLNNVIANNAYDIAVAGAVGNRLASASWAIPSILGDAGAGYFGVAGNSSLTSPAGNVAGLRAYNWSTGENAASVSYTNGTDFCFMQRHDTGNLVVSINGGTEATSASGNTLIMTGTLVLMKTVPVNGKFYGAVVCNSVLSSGNRASLQTWMGSKAGLTL